MSTEGSEDLQNPELVGDEHSISWFSIKAGVGDLLNDLERSLEERNPSFKSVQDHRWLHDLGHSGRGYDGFPSQFKLFLIKLGEHEDRTSFSMSSHQFVGEISTRLGEYLLGDEDKSFWRDEKPKRELERLKLVQEELERGGDVIYKTKFFERDDFKEDITTGSDNLDWFDPHSPTS